MVQFSGSTITPSRRTTFPLTVKQLSGKFVLDKLDQHARKPLTTRTPSQISWDGGRGRWRVRVLLNDRWVHVGCYPDKTEADYAAALALDPNTIPDPTITTARQEFIKKRIAYLHSIHQPEPEPAGT